MLGVLLLIGRMVFVYLWGVLGGNSVSSELWAEILLALVGDMVLGIIVALTFFHFQDKVSKDVAYDTIATSISIYAVSALALLLLAAIVPFDIVRGAPSNLFAVISTQLISIGTFVISIALAGFLTSLLIIRRHKYTKVFLTIQALVLLMVWLFSVLDRVNSAFNIAAIILTVVGSVVTLLNVRRLGWLVTTPLDKKIRLLWLSACGAFASIVLASMLAFSSDSFVTVSTLFFIRGGEVLPALINLFGFIFFLRLFFAVVASLPNSNIVDRRSSEVESLATLNRLIVQSVDTEELLTSATRFSQQVCRAHGAWCERVENGNLKVIGAQLVHPDYVRLLHTNVQIDRLFTTLDAPLLIPSLRDRFSDVPATSTIQSLILVPLVANHRREGTLVMFSTIEYGFEQDDLRLLTAFADTICLALDQERLSEAMLEKERLEKEFEVARKLQASLLPRTSPIIAGIEIGAITIPATQVGGDYFDFLEFPNGRYGIIIADVSGKGIPAAMYMATLKGAVLAEARSANGPMDLLARVNATLTGQMEKHTFITMMCVEYNPASSELRIARAGHTPAIVRRGGKAILCRPSGLAIGIASPAIFDAHIEEVSVTMEVGDICLLSTDGVNERRNTMLEEIGFDAVVDLVNDLNPTTAYDIVEATMALLSEHSNDTDQHDDITVIGMRFTRKSEYLGT